MGLIESKIPVMMHGKPGCGKTARVKAIDPDVEVLSLPYKDPSAIMGKTVFNPVTGKTEAIKPEWYDRFCEKCKQEPNKTHILFFDEITNAMPAIQLMSYQIVLDRIVNDKWKLPENCAVVAAGNEVEDSIAAYDMPEPLHSRFAHVYIVTTAENWLPWAMKNDIHPSIVSFIAWKKDSVLFTPFDGAAPNADPRKWEKASNLLKTTGKVKMMRSLVGADITTDFEAFCSIKMPSIEEVVAGKADMPQGVGARYATIGALSYAKETELQPVWKYVTKFEKEYQAIFMKLWTRGDGKRFEKISKLNGAVEIFEGLESKN